MGVFNIISKTSEQRDIQCSNCCKRTAEFMPVVIIAGAQRRGETQHTTVNAPRYTHRPSYDSHRRRRRRRRLTSFRYACVYVADRSTNKFYVPLSTLSHSIYPFLYPRAKFFHLVYSCLSGACGKIAIAPLFLEGAVLKSCIVMFSNAM